MARTIRNSFMKKLTYEKLMEAHIKSRKQKGYRKEIILFNLKQEEYIWWLYEKLKTGTYTHGGYTVFYITEPKLRKIEKSRYIDRIVHRWVVDNFMQEYFITTFISTSYACIKGKGMHKATLRVQKDMKHCKKIWEEYYILKMDVKKYFENINKDILYSILKRKITDEKLLWLLKEIIYSNEGKTGLAIRKLHFPSVCKYIFKRARPIRKTHIKAKVLLSLSRRQYNIYKNKARGKRNITKNKEISKRKIRVRAKPKNTNI